MAENTYQKLRAQVKNKQFSPVYVFYGEETYLRGHMTAQIQKALLPEGMDSFNLFKLEGKDVRLSELHDAVMSVPVMSEHKMVLVYDFDLYKIKEQEREEWIAFISSVPEECCLIFIYDVLPYKPDKRTKLYTALQKAVLTVEFAYQDMLSLCNWLMRRFAALQKAIDRSTCEYMIFRCGCSMTGLGNEVEKVAAYASGGTVTSKDIDAVVVPALEAVTFDLTDAVITGQVKKAAELLRRLTVMRTPPEMILGALSKTLRGLYMARLAVTQRRPARDVMEVCGYRSAYPAEKLMKSAAKRPIGWCRKALLLCRDADAQLKGESRERERVLEWMLASLI